MIKEDNTWKKLIGWDDPQIPPDDLTVPNETPQNQTPLTENTQGSRKNIYKIIPE